ncbi:PKD-like family lipoprotein [Chitinophaga lutea]
MKRLLCYIIFLAAFGAGCYKDKGNYDYSPINEVSIAGIDSAYTVLAGDSLLIIPSLAYSLDKGPDTAYTYEWFAVSLAVNIEREHAIGTGRDLRVKMTLPAGPYNVYYRIKDKRTGVQFQHKFKLNCQTRIYEGYLLLCDVNGESRLDMLSYYDNAFHQITDVLDTIGVKATLPRLGKPVFVNSYPYQPTTWGNYIFTETGGYRLDPETFEYKSTQNITYEFLSKLPADFAPQYLLGGSNAAWLYADGNIYTYFRPGNVFFGLPANTYQGSGVTFRASKWVVGSSPNGIVYDEDAKRFVKTNVQQTFCSVLPTGSKFNFTTGKDLLYMEFNAYTTGATIGTVSAVLEDKAAGKRFLARFTLTGEQTWYAEIKGTDIMKADRFAFSPELGFMYYTVGSKVYQYNPSLDVSTLVLDKGNKPITELKFQPFRYAATKTTTYKIWAPKLIVCTYDPGAPAGSCGTMDMLTVAPVTGTLTPFMSFAGLGKIASVAYRERN